MLARQFFYRREPALDGVGVCPPEEIAFSAAAMSRSRMIG
jgi:hypothetical protein